MYRRRRSAREPIAFSFDSFLDVVANVIGIIVRLILVAWVGARSYTATMQTADDPPASVRAGAPPSPLDDPVQSDLEKMRRTLEEARRRLLDQLDHLQLAERASSETRTELADLQERHHTLEEQAQRIGIALAEKGAKITAVVATATELKRRGAEVLKEIKALEAQPSRKQTLKYHTPVSRAVHADEMFFECRRGRVTFIDLPSFMQEVRNGLDDKVAALRSEWQVTHTTSPVGAFRLRYTVERERSALEGLGAVPAPGNFRYGLSEWTLTPIAEERGEPLDVALSPQSDFRRIVDRVDPQITVVTFWIYADSFALFRGLRDYLYERDIEVAGRPLNDGAPIAASRSGTASRGQ